MSKLMKWEFVLKFGKNNSLIGFWGHRGYMICLDVFGKSFNTKEINLQRFNIRP